MDQSKGDMNILLKMVNQLWDSNITAIEKMIEQTEEFYGLIADRLPKLEKSIDETIKETELLISFFFETDKEKNKYDYMMAEVLNELKKKINNLSSSLSGREKLLDGLEGFITDSKDDRQVKFTEILKMIKEIKRVLTQLKILSINVNVFSAQIGDRGLGFRVITKEINQISEKVNNIYQVVENNILTLQEWHRNFTENLNILFREEEVIKGEYRKEVEELFDNVFKSLQEIAVLLKNLLTNIHHAIEPISKIIILTQHQDIIKQNLENLANIIKKSKQELNLFRQKKNDMTSRDLIVFLIDSSSLSEKLTVNIIDQLEVSLFSIKEHFEEMNSSLVELKEDNQILTEFFAGEKGGGEKDRVSLEYIYKKLLVYIPKLKQAMSRLSSTYDGMIKNKDVFFTNMREINDAFTRISSYAEMFGKIKIMAKIEFARLQIDNQFINDIQLAIDDFIGTSKQNQKTDQDLKQILETNFAQFITLAEKNSNYINSSFKTIDGSREDLLLTSQLIGEAIQSLEKSIDELLIELIYINEKMSDCFNLNEIGLQVQKSFNTIKDDCERILAQYSNNNDVNDWKTNNKKIQELVEEFTSYLERKTARDELKNLDLDVGTEGGEIILF